MMIRLATRDDISAIAALHRSALDKEWNHESFEHFISSHHHEIWVAEDHAAITGFLIIQTATPKETEIISIAVDDAYRRQGIASALFKKITFPCFLEVRADNDAAIAFYISHSFVQIGCRENYYATNEGKIDALVMRSQP